jgi:hypothetical protein
VNGVCVHSAVTILNSSLRPADFDPLTKNPASTRINQFLFMVLNQPCLDWSALIQRSELNAAIFSIHAHHGFP